MTDAELGERVLREVFGAVHLIEATHKVRRLPDGSYEYENVPITYARGWSAVETLAAECERRGWEWRLSYEKHDNGFIYHVVIDHFDEPMYGPHDPDPGRAFALAMLEACGE